MRVVRKFDPDIKVIREQFDGIQLFRVGIGLGAICNLLADLKEVRVDPAPSRLMRRDHCIGKVSSDTVLYHHNPSFILARGPQRRRVALLAALRLSGWPGCSAGRCESLSKSLGTFEWGYMHAVEMHSPTSDFRITSSLD